MLPPLDMVLDLSLHAAGLKGISVGSIAQHVWESILTDQIIHISNDLCSSQVCGEQCVGSACC